MPEVVSEQSYSGDVFEHPIDRVERLATRHSWKFERRGEGEAVVEIPGQWGAWSLYIALARDINVLHLSCAFDVRIPDSARDRVLELLVLLNEKCWIGHFTVWLDEGLPMFRHTLLASEVAAGESIVEDMVDEQLTNANVYPAAFVINDGLSARDAVDSCLLDVAGVARSAARMSSLKFSLSSE